jgi:2-keto-4-pentenoate hydratase/2-oxohepta-3-ene-1,7-dioic acid hydratase in catechol pathway
MRLCRWGQPGSERPGVFDGDRRLDVSVFGQDYDEAFFGTDGPSRLARWLESNRERCPAVAASERHASSVARPSKLVCVGLNYRKHAQETGAEIPKEPILFFKATSAVVGPYDDLVLPRGSEKTDWEVELAVVIGRTARYVSEEHALEHVAGYVLHNDYSERAYQLERGGQWSKGKGCDTFAPLGPFLQTADELDASSLPMWLEVNGQRLQASNTDDMVFGVPTIVSYLSQFMTLLPGDVISTGTPSGVGMGLKPPRYLKTGDVVECGIEGLGTMRQRVVKYEQKT